MSEFNALKTSVSEGKALVAAAVTDKGVSTAAGATFQTMANNIRGITTNLASLFTPVATTLDGAWPNNGEMLYYFSGRTGLATFTIPYTLNPSKSYILQIVTYAKTGNVYITCYSELDVIQNGVLTRPQFVYSNTYERGICKITVEQFMYYITLTGQTINMKYYDEATGKYAGNFSAPGSANVTFTLYQAS